MKQVDIAITPKGIGENWERSCSWCESNEKNATYKIYNTKAEWMDYACEKHYQEHFKHGYHESSISQ